MLNEKQEIEKTEFTVYGRKIPLKEIRKKMLEAHKPFLRARDEEHYNNLSEQELQEQLQAINELPAPNTLSKEAMRVKLKEMESTRNLLVWLDNSSVANHGYLVCLITCLYDPAVFLTSEEYAIKTGQALNIQDIIETPTVHFIARCGSADCEQLMYTETRMQCIQQLKERITHDNIKYTDKMRFCHGDSPLRAFEAGHQKGGNYFCSSCGVFFNMVSEIDHVLNCQLNSLQDRQDKVLSGSVAKRKSLQQKAKPLQDLTKRELEEELGSRHIYSGKKKMELQSLLTEEMCGMQRVPALLFNTPLASLQHLGLDDYEILPAEPLHDIGNHINNVFTELPYHLSPEESKVLQESIETCLASKESKRTVDYRAALVKTTGYAHQSGIMSDKVLGLLDSLVEIQRILYLPDEKRSPSIILRFCNQVWYHSIILKELIPNPQKLTLRKLYGVYFHNLSAHAAIMLRIISGQSAHTENQERIFNHLKRITKSTSNYHPGHVIPNMLIRLKAEKEMGDLENSVSTQQSSISKLSKCLPPQENTKIPLDMVQRYSREWQAHLQQISDFLLEGKGKWWREDNEAIEFYDIYNQTPAIESGPPLHHFRSSTLASEAAYLKECWNKCIEQNIPIPTNILRLDQADGTTTVIHMTAIPQCLDSVHEQFDELPEYVDSIYENITNDEDIMNANEITNATTMNEESSQYSNGFSDTSDPATDIVDSDIYEEKVIDITPASDEIIALEDIITPITSQNSDPTCNISIPYSQGKETPEKNSTCISDYDDNTVHVSSRIGKAVQVVLGDSDLDEVIKFEHKYQLLKIAQHDKSCSTNTRKELESTYKDMLAQIQTKVLQKAARQSKN